MRTLTLLSVVFLGLSTCQGSDDEVPPVPDMKIELVVTQAERSLDSNNSQETYTLAGAKLSRESEYGGYRPGGGDEPKNLNVKLSAAQLKELHDWLTASKLLEDYEKAYTEEPPAPNFSRSESARATVTVGDKAATVKVSMAMDTLAKGSDGNIDDDDHYSDLKQLQYKLNSLLEP